MNQGHVGWSHRALCLLACLMVWLCSHAGSCSARPLAPRLALAPSVGRETTLDAAFEYSRRRSSRLATCRLDQLPPEARTTFTLIRKGGPFPYKRDGIPFLNREGRLPRRDRGYYREYTVPTPGASTRGARRIIAGRDGELYYTADHYKSFRRIEVR